MFLEFFSHDLNSLSWTDNDDANDDENDIDIFSRTDNQNI